MPRTTKKKDTTEDTIKAALQLFAEKGFARTTLEDVAEATGQDIKALRTKFGSKEELLIGAFRIGQIRMEAALRTTTVGSLDDNLAQLFDAIVEGLAPFGAEVHLNLAYQATKDKILLEIIKRSSENVNFAVKAFLSQLVAMSIIDSVDEVEKVNKEMVASCVEYLAGTLEGKKIPDVRKAWVKHIRTMLQPSSKTNVPGLY